MGIELNGNKMVPMMRDVYGGLNVCQLRMKPTGNGFTWWTHYKGNTAGTSSTITAYKEIWPNQFNTGEEVVNSGGSRATVNVGNIGTRLWTPGLSYRPCGGHIEGTGSIRAENGSYSNSIFNPQVAGISSALKDIKYTTNNEVAWETSSTARINVENSFWQSSDPYKFSAFAYYLINVYNMPLSLGTNPFVWNIYSSFKEGNTAKYGSNNCTTDVVATKAIDTGNYQTWLVKSKNTSNYLLKQDNPYQSSFADFLYNLAYVDFPRLKINTTTSNGWFQVISMGMEFWCTQHS